MTFSIDSSCLILSCHDRRIYVVDVKKSEVTNIFVPPRKKNDINLPPSEPPITKMFTSSDGRWLIAVNCFGDIYIFDLQIHKQHWFISQLNGASVTAGDFPPGNSNVFVVTTSLNQIYAFDINGKQLSEWSRWRIHLLLRRFHEFPGEVIGLSFSPSLYSTSAIVYSTRAMCLIDLGMPIDQDKDSPKNSGLPTDKYETIIHVKANLKLKNQNAETKSHNRSSDFCSFIDPVLFVGHLSDNSWLIIGKRWMDIVQRFDAPVHRLVYGT